MQDLPVLLAITGFTVMGIVATAGPAFVTARFGILMALALPVALGRLELRDRAAHSTQRKTMKYVCIVALLVAGIIHLLPVPGVMGVGTLARLYGIEASDPNTAILLQHRALLFGVLGALMLSAIALPWLRITALSVGLFSAASFIVVAMSVGGYNSAIDRVVFADLVASVLLAAGLAVELWLIGRRTA